MAFLIGEFKKFCKENGIGIRTGLFGVSKNDSGKCDMYVETEDTVFAVKVFTVGDGAERVYFKNAGGYVTVKGSFGENDYLWVKPDFDVKMGAKKTVGILLLSDDVAATELAKNRATTVTAGAKAFDCVIHTPSSFAKLFAK